MSKIITLKGPQASKRLRRIALHAQGLLSSNPFGKGLAGTVNAISHIGYVQIDTISVVARAHHHVLQSRVPQFHPKMTNQLLKDRHTFEYWSHAAAFLPIQDFRYSLPYKQAIKRGQTHWHKNPDQHLMAELLAQIKSDGPLKSRDLDSNIAKKCAGWWDWKPAKKALEQLFMQGDLMVTNRDGFQKCYDLTERVLPCDIDTRPPSMVEFATHLIEQQLRCHGFVSLTGFTYLRRNSMLRKSVKEQLTQGLNHGIYQQFCLNGDTYITKSGMLEKPLPRVTKRMLILSPFDNTVIQRQRLKAVFDYDYQIECYVPQNKRQFGYFSLPLLLCDEFVGRMDCKAHRKSRHLELKAIYFEQHAFEQDFLFDALVNAVSDFLQFQQCDTVSIGKIYPTTLSAPINKVFASTFNT